LIIQNIANGERCLAKTMANNILELNGLEPSIEEVLYPEPAAEEKRSKPQYSNTNSSLISYELKTYPNPANEYFTIELPEGMFSINLINAQGQLVYEIAQSGYSLSATIAIGTLNYFFDSTYTFPFNPLEGSNARTSGYSSNNKKISEFKNLYCSPNPANNYVVFHYNLLNERNGEIVIYTLDGKPLDKIVLNNEFGEIVYDTQSLTAGVYQYRLSLNGKLKEAQKLVIVKN
jgi:hypothetical protein